MRGVFSVLLVSSCLLPACGSSSHGAAGGPDAGSITFPKSFVFGTAIAGFQADMGCPTLGSTACTICAIVAPTTKGAAIRSAVAR
jgi:hypothetical protein